MSRGWKNRPIVPIPARTKKEAREYVDILWRRNVELIDLLAAAIEDERYGEDLYEATVNAATAAYLLTENVSRLVAALVPKAGHDA